MSSSQQLRRRLGWTGTAKIRVRKRTQSDVDGTPAGGVQAGKCRTIRLNSGTFADVTNLT
jgi:hypothetical protein